MDDAILPTEAYDAENYIWHENTTAASGNTSTPGSLRPPKYTVDLSLPPEQRYLHIVPDFIHHLEPLPQIFDELTDCIPWVPGSLLRFLAKLSFRKIYDEEEDRELRGIAKAVGIDRHLLIALNTLLDLFMGCTSGGVRVRDSRNQRKTSMLHFRTLDWGMDPLRKLVMEVDFVNGAGGEVLYTSITYFGYVGVLTGLRKGLSLALNFRPLHDSSTIKKRLSFRWHQALVLLGRRRGIASDLRMIMAGPLQSPKTISRELQKKHSTAAYITLCDGQSTVVLDNDNRCGVIREDSNFILAVNHDVMEGQESAQYFEDQWTDSESWTRMSLIVYMSTDRQECVETLWAKDRKESRHALSVTKDQVIHWMETCRDLSNNETHFGIVMDPVDGRILWLQRYLEPLKWTEYVGNKPEDRYFGIDNIEK